MAETVYTIFKNDHIIGVAREFSIAADMCIWDNEKYIELVRGDDGDWHSYEGVSKYRIIAFPLS